MLNYLRARLSGGKTQKTPMPERKFPGLNTWSTCSDVYKVVHEMGGNLEESLANSTTIVTGSNTGIGKKTAEYLALLGGDVIIACRSLKKGNEAIEEIRKSAESEAKKLGKTVKGADLHLIPMELDLSSFQSVRSFVQNCVNKVTSGELPKLRLVVCNAGVVAFSAPFYSVDGYEITFAVNHLGHFLLINEFVKYDIWSSQGGRIVVAASHSHYGTLLTKEVTDEKELREKVFKFDSKVGHETLKAYGSSKLANVMFAQSLHGTALPNGADLTACSLHPGSMIGTEIARQSMIASFFTKYILAWFTKSIDQGSSTSFLCSLLPDDYIKGQYWSDCNECGVSRLTEEEKGKDARELLWIMSAEAVSQPPSSNPGQAKL